MSMIDAGEKGGRITKTRRRGNDGVPVEKRRGRYREALNKQQEVCKGEGD